MSLYGALFAGVSGLTAQANSIGVVSDNIANVNTVGFRALESTFSTLVTNSGTISHSPGGAQGGTRTSVSLQGLLQTTTSNTDIAISGDGFFAVNTQPDGTGSINYTRAGSFREDSLGNFVNSGGFFLQGFPLDREGRLPGEPGNANTTSVSSLAALETVNVSSFTGAAAATTSIAVSANLNQAATQFQGAGATVAFDSNSPSNFQISSNEIIVPSSTNSLTSGDRFTLDTGNGLSQTFRYGGFTFSRDITNGAVGDSGVNTGISPVALGENPFTTTNASQTVSVRQGNHGLETGEVITLSGVVGGINSEVNGIPASDLNQSFVITVIDEDNFEIQTANAANAGGAGGGTGIQSDFREFTGNIFDANTASSNFLSSTTGFSNDALTFTVTTNATGTSTFTYTSGTPNSQLGQFNNLNNLATAISNVNGLTARIVNNQLFVSADDANEAITFANGSNTSVGSGSTLSRGLDWVGELGLANVSTGFNRFSTLDGLSNVINGTPGFSATINNSNSAASLDINVDDPLDTLTLNDFPVNNVPAIVFGGAESPFGTTIGSSEVTITFPTAHGFSANDIVTLDPSSIPGFPSAAEIVGSLPPLPGQGAFSTVDGSNLVTVTQAGHTFSPGDEVGFDVTTIAGFPNGSIGGIPLTEFNDLVTITAVGVPSADDFTFAVNSNATATGVDSAVSGNFTASPTINGIPLTDIAGSFEISNVTTNAFVIDVGTAATSIGNEIVDGLSISTPTNGGSVLAELGVVASLNSAAFTGAQSTGSLGPSYDPLNPDTNIAGGNVTPEFPINVPIFDSLGAGHDIQVAFLPTGVNTFAVEVFALNPDEVSDSFPNGQLASGSITFNGDGSLASVDASLSAPIEIIWTNGAEPSSITLDLGTAGPVGTGDTDGLSQFDATNELNFANQNGVPVGELIGVEIGNDGIVTATFSNGETQDLYQIPLADFSNPDGLESVTGNVFTETNDSGTVALRLPGASGVGTLQASALEQSNVELSEELTGMIIAQRSYQANTRVVTTSDELLEELNNILRQISKCIGPANAAGP